MQKSDLPNKVAYYLAIAKAVSQKSTCYRARLGAIIVRNDQIIAAGYVGAPRGTKDCLERGECLREKLGIPHGERYELCRSVHAEQNAIINAARAGVILLDGEMYLYCEDPQTGTLRDALPCYFCKRMIINAGLTVFHSQMKDGSVKDFNISDWVRDWQEHDIVDDKYKYGK